MIDWLIDWLTDYGWMFYGRCTAKCGTQDNHMVLDSYDNHMAIIRQSYDI